MSSVIRAQIGQGPLMHIVPEGSGQLFLVGHLSLTAFCCKNKETHTASGILKQSVNLAMQYFLHPLLCFLMIINDTWTCSPSSPTHKRIFSHLGPTPPTLSSPLSIFSSPTPTELIPGARFSRSASLPTHALTLSQSQRAALNVFSRFPLLDSHPPTPKGCESLLTCSSTRRALVC